MLQVMKSNQLFDPQVFQSDRFDHSETYEHHELHELRDLFITPPGPRADNLLLCANSDNQFDP